MSKFFQTAWADAQNQTAVETQYSFRPGTLGLKGSSGRVASVTPGSQASGKGIKPGWKIAKLNGRQLNSDWSMAQTNIQSAIQGTKPYTITFARDVVNTKTTLTGTWRDDNPDDIFGDGTPSSTSRKASVHVSRSTALEENARSDSYAKQKGNTWGMIGFTAGALGIGVASQYAHNLNRIGMAPKVASCLVLGMGGWMYGREQGRSEFRRTKWVKEEKMRDTQEKLDQERRERTAKFKNAKPIEKKKVSNLREDFKGDTEMYALDVDKLYQQANRESTTTIEHRRKHAFSKPKPKPASAPTLSEPTKKKKKKKKGKKKVEKPAEDRPDVWD